MAGLQVHSRMTFVGDLVGKIRQQPAVIRLWSDRTLHLFGTDNAGAGAPPELDIRINNLEHIERFEQTLPWLDRDTFIATNIKAVEKANRFVFTVADERGPLLGFAYAQANARDSYFPHIESRIVWPELTATMYGAFIHPVARGRRLHAALQDARYKHLIGTLGMRWAINSVIGGNLAALASTRRGSSRQVADLMTRYRFGRASKSIHCYEPGMAFVVDEAAR